MTHDLDNMEFCDCYSCQAAREATAEHKAAGGTHAPGDYTGSPYSSYATMVLCDDGEYRTAVDGVVLPGSSDKERERALPRPQAVRDAEAYREENATLYAKVNELQAEIAALKKQLGI